MGKEDGNLAIVALTQDRELIAQNDPIYGCRRAPIESSDYPDMSRIYDRDYDDTEKRMPLYDDPRLIT